MPPQQTPQHTGWHSFIWTQETWHHVPNNSPKHQHTLTIKGWRTHAQLWVHKRNLFSRLHINLWGLHSSQSHMDPIPFYRHKLNFIWVVIMSFLLRISQCLITKARQICTDAPNKPIPILATKMPWNRPKGRMANLYASSSGKSHIILAEESICKPQFTTTGGKKRKKKPSVTIIFPSNSL